MITSIQTRKIRHWILVLFLTLGATVSLTAETQLQGIHVEDGTLYFEDGSEVALWGVNFQTAMSYELMRFQKAGHFKPFDLEAWQEMLDRSFDEIQLVGCDVIRIHLSPKDLADSQGNLVETPWLKMLDYTMAECRKRGIYVNLALLNHLGFHFDDSFIGTRHGKESKWEWITVPEHLKASDNYIRQLVNRKNPEDGNIRYKDNPAWVVAEFINEPMFPREKPSRKDSPLGVKVYEEWLKENSKPDTGDSFSEYKYLSIKSYINRIAELLEEEEVPAIPCWNLFWVRGPQHEGWESYDAAADSKIELISFSTYPGQSEIQRANRKPMDLSGMNFLPYLQRAYDQRDWQGWIREDRFKGKCASIVYEYEAWANQSAYIYPAMAKYFRAQGAQMATMWTYTFNGLAEHLGRFANHNLNAQTTPKKSAGFMVAGEIFRNTPRYLSYWTTSRKSDDGTAHAFSFATDYAAYFDSKQLVYSGNMDTQVVDIPNIPERIVGYGSSPFVDYEGSGITYLERKASASEEIWTLTILPNARFVSDLPIGKNKSVELDIKSPNQIRLNLPGEATETRIYSVLNGDAALLQVFSGGSDVTLNITPGDYLIERKL
ncbi:MAG: hypothetical protein AB3N63_19200 [Puniceicoccaceae bacterium]